MPVFQAALAAHFKHGRTDLGPRHVPGAALLSRAGDRARCSPSTCYAHACTVAEVEVDTETGEVAVLSLKSAYEVGRALNPKMVEQQIVGGAWMGMSHALYETTEPYYPDRAPRAGRLQRISDAGAGRPAGVRERRAGAARPTTGRSAPRASAR